MWIRLIMRAELLSEASVTQLCEECSELCSIVGKSIVTAKNKGKKDS